MQLEGRDPRVRDLAAVYATAYADTRAGRIDDAVRQYRDLVAGCRAIEDPDRSSLLSAGLQQLGFLADGGLTDGEIALAEETAAATSGGSEPGWIVRFGLGQTFAERGDAAAAMAWFDAANAMRRAALSYDADAMDRVFADLARTFDAETIARLSKSGGRSPKPVFIVGMPRSGTTLVEQVLASVPGVHGAGELTAIGGLARDIHAKEGAWPGGATALTAGRVTRLATAYLVHLHKLAPRAERVVDKMPANAQNVGLILSLFPNATVLHVRRDPLDNCFGCYRQLFRGEVNYCYEQTELGRYHQGLERLMDHWKAAAPGRIVDVDYGALVRDFEAEARRLVDATGMPWSDACLDFHKTEREIDTASSKQARQPLFTSGLGAADPYRPFLRPLEAALAA